MTIEVGSTYSRRVGDNIEAVTIDRPCQYGGWWGTNANGTAVRVTEKTLITSNTNNTTSQEDTNMAPKPAARVTAADRRARRAGNSTTATVEPSASEKLDMATAKPAAAKAAPKTTDNSTATTTKENNTMPVTKPAAARRRTRKSAAKPVEVVTETTMEETVATLAAKLAADMLVDLLAAQNATEEVEEQPVVAKLTAKRAPAKSGGKSVKVTLKANVEKKHSWQFGYKGTSNTPAVTGCYILKDAIEALEAGEKSLTATFDNAEGKKGSILFRESEKMDTSIFNGSLYVMRNALNGSGISEDTPIKVVVTVKADDEIMLAISKA